MRAKPQSVYTWREVTSVQDMSLASVVVVRAKPQSPARASASAGLSRACVSRARNVMMRFALRRQPRSNVGAAKLRCAQAERQRGAARRGGSLAGVQGFEPQLADPESAVLPLNDTPIYLAERVCVRSARCMIS